MQACLAGQQPAGSAQPVKSTAKRVCVKLQPRLQEMIDGAAAQLHLHGSASKVISDTAAEVDLVLSEPVDTSETSCLSEHQAEPALKAEMAKQVILDVMLHDETESGPAVTRSHI